MLSEESLSSESPGDIGEADCICSCASTRLLSSSLFHPLSEPPLFLHMQIDAAICLMVTARAPSTDRGRVCTVRSRAPLWGYWGRSVRALPHFETRYYRLSSCDRRKLNGQARAGRHKLAAIEPVRLTRARAAPPLPAAGSTLGALTGGSRPFDDLTDERAAHAVKSP